MAPKVKITKAEIISTALDLVRENGDGALNARSIAAALGCSTQPVFSNFASMEELDKEVVLAAYERYLGFIKQEVESGKYPQYKAFGMAYIRFAKEEKELFKLLFMCDRSCAVTPTSDFDASVELIMKANGITKEKAELMHLEMWTCVHGIGAMLATSFLSLDWELISEMVTDVYQGIRARHLSEGNNK
jgi:AcrR family transcriptional regulator